MRATTSLFSSPRATRDSPLCWGRLVRAATLLFGAALSLAIVLPVTAQSFGTLFNGVNPRNINLVPIDTNKALKTMNVNSAFRTPAQSKAFSLGNAFPKLHMPTWPPKIASTPILGQKNNPFQPNPVFGKNPFAAAPTK